MTHSAEHSGPTPNLLRRAAHGARASAAVAVSKLKVKPFPWPEVGRHLMPITSFADYRST